MSQTIDGQNVNRNGILIRGLIILLCAGIINATSVFITPLAEFYGWEASAIANVGTTMLTFWPIGSLLGGKLLQKFGGKAVTLIGAVTFGGSGADWPGAQLHSGDVVFYLQLPDWHGQRHYILRRHVLRYGLVSR